MAVHIRLARAGTKKVPYYRIVAADHRAPRGGRFIERLGTWDPRCSELTLDRTRVRYWLEHGAQASHTVGRLLKRAETLSKQAVAEGGAEGGAETPAPAEKG